MSKPVSIQARRKKRKAQPKPTVTVQWHYEPDPNLAQTRAWKEFWDHMYTGFLQARQPAETAA